MPLQAPFCWVYLFEEHSVGCGLGEDALEAGGATSCTQTSCLGRLEGSFCLEAEQISTESSLSSSLICIAKASKEEEMQLGQAAAG